MKGNSDWNEIPFFSSIFFHLYFSITPYFQIMDDVINFLSVVSGFDDFHYFQNFNDYSISDFHPTLSRTREERVFFAAEGWRKLGGSKLIENNKEHLITKKKISLCMSPFLQIFWPFLMMVHSEAEIFCLDV